MPVTADTTSVTAELLDRLRPWWEMQAILREEDRVGETFLLLWVNMRNSAWLMYVEGPDYVDRWLVRVGEVLAGAVGPGRMYSTSDQYWVVFTPDQEKLCGGGPSVVDQAVPAQRTGARRAHARHCTGDRRSH